MYTITLYRHDQCQFQVQILKNALYDCFCLFAFFILSAFCANQHITEILYNKNQSILLELVFIEVLKECLDL